MVPKVKETKSEAKEPTRGDLMMIIYCMCGLLKAHGDIKFRIDTKKIGEISKKQKLMIEAKEDGIVEVWTPQKPKDRKRILRLNKELFTGPN